MEACFWRLLLDPEPERLLGEVLPKPEVFERPRLPGGISGVPSASAANSTIVSTGLEREDEEEAAPSLMASVASMSLASMSISGPVEA